MYPLHFPSSSNLLPSAHCCCVHGYRLRPYKRGLVPRRDVAVQYGVRRNVSLTSGEYHLKKFTRTHKGLACAAVSIALVAGGVATSASAAPTTSSTSDTAAIYAFYDANGVSKADADRLVANFERGIYSESNNPNAVPVRSKMTIETGFEVTRTFYADGSVSVSKIEQPKAPSKGLASTQSVGSCAETTGGSGYILRKNCLVSEGTDILEMAFRMDWTAISSGYDKINAVRSPYAYTRGGTAETPKLSISKANESSASPASARATTQYQGANSFTATLTAKVGGDKASSSKSW